MRGFLQAAPMLQTKLHKSACRPRSRPRRDEELQLRNSRRRSAFDPILLPPGILRTYIGNLLVIRCGHAMRCRRRRGAGAVERGGLENRCAFTGTQGSNPCLSASRHAAAAAPDWKSKLPNSRQRRRAIECRRGHLRPGRVQTAMRICRPACSLSFAPQDKMSLILRPSGPS